MEQITESMSQFNDGLQQMAQSIRSSRETVTLLTEASQDLQQVVKVLGRFGSARSWPERTR
jgi:methyl-accepting chemotaxis protein